MTHTNFVHLWPSMTLLNFRKNFQCTLQDPTMPKSGSKLGNCSRCLGPWLKTREAVLWLQIWFKMASLNSLWDYFTKNWHSNWHWNCNIWKQIRKNHQLNLACPIFCPILIWCTEAIQFVCKKINTNMTPDLVNCNNKVKIGPKSENKIFNLGKL